jgi:CheY-like chemotaxis protein
LWSPDTVRRILVVDDNAAVHGDFRKILCPAEPNHALDELESKLFADTSTRTPPKLPFSVDAATQGREGHAMVLQALRTNDPYALAFVDMRMPPGWDGIETIQHIQKDDPAIEIVICSAYTEYSWKEVIERLKRPSIQFLPKPFHSRDVLELAWALTTKWLRQRRAAVPG